MSALKHQTENSENFPVSLVIGGAGFLGSSLCLSLLEKNLKVVAIDNLITGKKENLSALLSNPGFSFQEADINNFVLPDKLIPGYIFHLAGVEEYINGLDVSLETLLVNSIGTKKILDLTKDYQAKLLVVSSLSVYEGVLGNLSLVRDFGLSQSQMQKYTHHEAKRFSEALTSEYFRKFNIDARVVRVRDCYGPRMPLEEGSGLSKLFLEAATDKELLIEGDGLDLIHPTFISDIVEGLGKAMFYPETTGKIYTLVNPEQITLLNFAYSMQKVSKGSLKIKFIPAENVLKFPKKQLEIGKTQEELNWEPQTRLEEGIEQTLNFFQNQNILQKTTLPETPGNKQEKNPPPNNTEEETPVVEEKNITPKDLTSELLATITEKPNTAKPELSTVSPSIQTPTPVTSVSNLNISPSLLPLPKKPINGSISKIRQPKFSLFLISLFFLIFLLGFPFLFLGLESYLGARNLEKSLSSLENGNFVKAQKESQYALTSFQNAHKTLDSLNWFYTIFKIRKNGKDSKEIYEIGESTANIFIHASFIGQNLSGLKDDFILGFSENSRDKIKNAVLEINTLNTDLSLIEALVKNNKITCPFNLNICQKGQNYLKNTSLIKQNINRAGALLEILPQLLASNNPQNYLVLLQNNMELRGGGGFIGSVALASFDNGKLINFKIEDSYSLDGQLKGHVDPPDEILHFLGQPDWYLRDSNYSGDFPLSAQRAAWFFEKETGVLVDGVVALDLNLAKLILEVTGPIHLSDYQKEITADNLFQIAEEEAEKNFFPGSTQKKDFLSSLFNGILTKFTSEKSFPALPALINVGKAIDEKHLLFYSSKENLENVFIKTGLAGNIIDNPCTQTAKCASLGSYIVENNYGANKANFFLSKKTERKISLGREGQLVENIQINYKNNSPTNTWPGGVYKSFVKFFVPAQSRLLKIDLGDDKKATLSSSLTADVLKKIKKDEFLVYESSESGKKFWGILLEIPIKKERTLEITYESPEKLPLRFKDPTLFVYQQKQPGVQNDPFTISIEYPSFLKIKSLSPPDVPIPVANTPVVSYNTTLSTDKKLEIQFTR